MTELLVCIAFVAVIRIVRRVAVSSTGLLESKRQPASDSLCVGCTSAHVQYGADGKRAVACTFGGGVRTVQMVVLYCTDYCDRNVPQRKVAVGFVPLGLIAEVAKVKAVTH